MILFIPVGSVISQESNQYSLFMLQKYALNPAFAGLESSLSVTGGYRSQWQELPGSPSSKIIMAQMPLYYLNGAGGIKIEQESFGAESTVRGMISYNYVYHSQIGLISGGLGLGFIQKSVDGTQLKTPTGKYEGGLIFHNDDILSNNDLKGIAPAFQAGVYLAQDRFEGGISIENFHSPKIGFNRSNAYYKIFPRLNIYGEYLFDLNEDITITPSLLIKTDFKKVQTEIAGMAAINQKIYGGLGVRGYSNTTLDALMIVGGIKLSENLKVYYNFDITLSSLRTAHQGTHEILFNYNLHKSIGKVHQEPIIYNPRY